MFQKYSLTLITIFFAVNTNAALPIYPAEIIARDLSIPGAGWAGHVGVTTAPNIWQDAYQVIEVLKYADPVIQTNLIATFKIASPYWGSRYGIADRGNNALRILREANFQKDLGCATYTLSVEYDPSTGSYDAAGRAIPTYCGYFRCDTFINYLFYWGGYKLPTYNPPRQIGNASIPKYVFNAFPYGNGDGPFAIDPISSITKVLELPLLTDISINTASAEILKVLSPEEFAKVVDISRDKITHKGIKNIFLLIQDSRLDIDKRTFLMDKLGFVGTAEMIPSLINLYEMLQNTNELPIKNQLIATLQNIYQRHLMLEKLPGERKHLTHFYLKIMDDSLLPVEKGIVIRGLISLSPAQNILLNLTKIKSKIFEQDNKLSSQNTLKLHMEILNKSVELENIILPDIINQLENENKVELDEIFSFFIVNRLSQLGPNNLTQQSKEQIRTYLDSIKYKYDSGANYAYDKEYTLVSAGIWLEASALVNSNSLKDAGKFIAEYLKDKDKEEQMRYIVGLSNSDYMQNAFQTEPVLSQFKKNNNDIFINTVGTPKLR